MSVGPSLPHHRMWWALVKAIVPHPGNRHPPSRLLRARTIRGEGSLELRPRPFTQPLGPTSTVSILASQARRRAVDTGTTPPPSRAHPGSDSPPPGRPAPWPPGPRRSRAGSPAGPESPSPPHSTPTGTWTTTVARSGSGSAATLAEQIATRASARRCPGLGESSAGTCGSLRIMRCTALTTTRPSADGRRPSNSSCRPSGSCHQSKLRSASRATTSEAEVRASSLPFSLMVPGATRSAQGRSPPSVCRVANLVSSTTLSTPSRPELKASDVRGKDSSARAEAIQRLAFQSETP